jgi:type IV pilus assembly protein PilY1
LTTLEACNTPPSGNDNLYYGYFVSDKYYTHTGTKFEEDASCTVYANTDEEYLIGDAASGCMSGNLLNWATMSRIDLMRKVLIGGKSVSTQTNAHTLRPEGGWRTFSDHTLGCTFTLSGGSYPNLDHDIAITDYDCGNLDVRSTGSLIFGTSDSFRYIYQNVTGDFDARLLVTRPPSESGQTYAKAGLMVRGDTTAGSRNFKIMATHGSGLQISYRAADGGDTTLVGGYVPATYPVWVRIARASASNTYTAYYSSDGTTWTTHGSANVGMTANVLLGMASASYSTTIYGNAYYDEFLCDTCTDDDFNDGVFDTATWTALDIATSLAGSQTEDCSGGCAVGTLASSSMKVDVPLAEKSGLLHDLSDKDNDAEWDADAPRFGLMVYAGDSRYGEIRAGIEGSNMSSFLTALQSEPPYGNTPTGEALYEAQDYFAQANNYPYETNNSYIGAVGGLKDPMCEGNGADRASVSCRKNFILLISDGEWNEIVDPVVPARESLIKDIRPDIAEGFQNVTTYTVYTFGDDAGGRNSLQQTAMYGSFVDTDGNNWPYNRTGYPVDSRTATLPAAPCDPNSLPMDESCIEWDEVTQDGIPDTYYEASNGNELRAKLIDAISDMLKRASSGTAVSVLSTSGEGDGAIYQAYFFPQKLDGLSYRKWLGYVQSIFVDEYGNMREDTDGDKALNLTSDLILEMEYSVEFGTQIKKYNDTGGDGDKDGAAVAIVEMTDVNAIWKGGNILWQTDPANRTIYSSVNGYNLLDFSTANSATLEPYLRVADSTEAANMINWVRGADLGSTTDTTHVNGYRNRNVTINNVTNVWKLGDIVYSTPSVVGKPMENYDFIYGDISYKEFESNYLNRRHVLYAGANDGMIHAFNAGCFDDSDHKFYPDPSGTGCTSAGTHTLGEELWAFIPRGLLPHLQWHSQVDYTHVYYVDQKPKVTDIKAFNSDATHIGGWGTVLIGGFRYGGKSISWTSGATKYSSSPEYFALDVTDPLNPRLLWTFADSDFGLSMSYPSVAKIGDSWYAIFGSGATNYDEASNLTSFQDGYIFVLKISGGNNGVIDTWTENSNFWKIPTGKTTSFLADSITVDRDLIDYAVDVIYIGENYQQGGNWNSLMRRLTTAHGTETVPSSWQLSTLMDVNDVAGNKDYSKRITSAPSAASDDRGNLWTFFGTGQFYGLDDKNVTDSGGFYAVKDHCWDGSCTDSYTGLLDVSGASVDIDGSISGIGATCGSGTTTEWHNLISTVDTCDGWSIFFDSVGESTDFAGDSINHTAERSLSKPVVVGGVVAWASYIPGTDECSSLGESNAYAVYYKTGTAYKNYTFEEQKTQDSPSTTVARVKSLGVGMPSSPSTQITKEGKAKLYFQQSTGAILTIENDTPFPLKSGVQGWKSEHIP